MPKRQKTPEERALELITSEAGDEYMGRAIKQFTKAVENWPYPPGKQYRALSRKYDREMQRCIQAVRKKSVARLKTQQKTKKKSVCQPTRKRKKKK